VTGGIKNEVKLVLLGATMIVLTLCSTKFLRTEMVTDPESGLIVGKGYKRVDAYCTGCHTAAMITKHRATRTNWMGIVRRMQKIGEWTLDPDIETEIVDYLSINYPANHSNPN